jgi:sialic acid synthase SpsE
MARIGQFLVGPEHPTFVIAELGLNHNGRRELLHRLVDAALLAGADAIKVQVRTPQAMMAPSMAEAYWSKGRGFGMTQLDARQELELGGDCLNWLGRCGMVWGASVFDVGSVERLQEFRPSFLKVPSHAATNHNLLRAVADVGLPVIASTGGLTDREVALLREVLPAGTIYLHCVSRYPTPVEECDLGRIRRLELDGYSSHESAAAAVPVAVGAGACVVERHLTLSRVMLGVDHAISSAPGEFALMVSAIRTADAALRGSPAADCRRSYHVAWHARAAIPGRTVITADQVWLCQPCPDRSWPGYTSVVGRTARHDISSGECIMLEDVE